MIKIGLARVSTCSTSFSIAVGGVLDDLIVVHVLVYVGYPCGMQVMLTVRCFICGVILINNRVNGPRNVMPK